MSSAADIEAQAAAWIARSDARDGDQEAELAAWLIADPRHRAAYLRLAHAWERTQRLARLRPSDRSIDPDLLAPPRRPDVWARLRRRAAAAIDNNSARPAAAAAAVAAALLLAIWGLLPAFFAQSYSTGPDGLSRIILADGSAVTMNANTEVRVHFTAARRTVTLLRGEAHFSVTHDTRRPFEVHARSRVVVAVGTAFDVRLAPGHDVEVTVTEGRVALFEDSAKPPQPGEPALQTIAAGDEAFLTAGRASVRRIDSAEIFRRLTWERRELSFEGQTLSQAVAEFSRYSNRRIVIDDPAIASLEIGGSFRALDIDSFIAALGRAFDISSRVTARGTIHLYRVGNVEPARLHR